MQTTNLLDIMLTCTRVVLFTQKPCIHHTSIILLTTFIQIHFFHSRNAHHRHLCTLGTVGAKTLLHFTGVPNFNSYLHAVVAEAYEI